MGADYTSCRTSANMLGRAQERIREQLIEKVSEADDKLLEKYLHGEEITEAKSRGAAQARQQLGAHGRREAEPAFVPFICGSAFKNKGVQPLLDAVVDYLPSPVDVPSIKGFDPDKGPDSIIERPAADDAPFAALGVQDHDRPVCRSAHVHPRLLRRHDGGSTGLQLRRSRSPSVSAAC
jgi:elongation factor G